MGAESVNAVRWRWVSREAVVYRKDLWKTNKLQNNSLSDSKLESGAVRVDLYRSTARVHYSKCCNVTKIC